ncbi:hypothetical protein BH09BAC4_BH09BAC4_22880 [soil metagenome]
MFCKVDNYLIWFAMEHNYLPIVFIFLSWLLTNPFACAQHTPAVQPDSTQLQNHRYIELFRSNTDMSYLSPKGELGAPSKYVLNGELITNFFVLATRTSRLSLAFTPRFTIRIRDGASSPVGTPSYRIGLRAFYRLTHQVARYHYLEGQMYHHSNGQDGDALRTNGTYNTDTGDFATNYVQGNYHWGTYHRHHYGTNYNLGIRWHAPFFHHSEGLKDQYGFTRLVGQALYRRFHRSSSTLTTLHKSSVTSEWFRISGQASYAVNKLNGAGLPDVRRRLNAELSVYYIPPFGHDTGVFITVGYYGEDPYNIYFNQQYGFVRLGISAGYTRYDEDVRR